MDPRAQWRFNVQNSFQFDILIGGKSLPTNKGTDGNRRRYKRSGSFGVRGNEMAQPQVRLAKSAKKPTQNRFYLSFHLWMIAGMCLFVFAPPSFVILFIMAVRALPNKEVHRNHILIAAIAILMSSINRVYMTMNVCLAAMLWHTWEIWKRLADKLGSARRSWWCRNCFCTWFHQHRRREILSLHWGRWPNITNDNYRI